jgi:hypothetical protein
LQVRPRTPGGRRKGRKGVVAVFIVVFCIAALAVSSPIFAAFIVSVASKHEDARWSLGRPPSNALNAIGRRIVAFDADSIVWPRSKAHMQAERAQRAVMPEPNEPETGTGNRSAA